MHPATPYMPVSETIRRQNGAWSSLTAQAIETLPTFEEMQLAYFHAAAELTKRQSLYCKRRGKDLNTIANAFDDPRYGLSIYNDAMSAFLTHQQNRAIGNTSKEPLVILDPHDWSNNIHGRAIEPRCFLSGSNAPVAEHPVDLGKDEEVLQIVFQNLPEGRRPQLVKTGPTYDLAPTH